MREYPQIRLRVSPDLKDAIEHSARESGRSMNAEIVFRLESTIRKEDVIRQKLDLPKATALAIAELEAAAASIQMQIDKLKEQG